MSCSQVLEIRVKNEYNAAVGDTVEIETGSSAVIGVAALVFLLPLLLAFAAYFITETLTSQRLYGYLAALAMLVITYTVIAVVVRKMNKTLSVTMTAILEKHTDPSDPERQTEFKYEQDEMESHQ